MQVSLSATKRDPSKYQWYKFTGKRAKFDGANAKYDLELVNGDRFGVRTSGDNVFLVDASDLAVQFKLPKTEADKLLKKSAPYKGTVGGVKVGIAQKEEKPKNPVATQAAVTVAHLEDQLKALEKQLASKKGSAAGIPTAVDRRAANSKRKLEREALKRQILDVRKQIAEAKKHDKKVETKPAKAPAAAPAAPSNAQQSPYDKVTDAVGRIKGLQLQARRFVVRLSDGKTIASISEWLDTNRIVVTQGGKQRTTTVKAFIASLQREADKTKPDILPQVQRWFKAGKFKEINYFGSSSGFALVRHHSSPDEALEYASYMEEQLKDRGFKTSFSVDKRKEMRKGENKIVIEVAGSDLNVYD